MQFRDLEDYIASFGKTPGSFSTEEIILIGNVHKELPNKIEKDWGRLVKLLGWRGSGESLRMFIRRHPAKNYEVIEDIIDSYSENPSVELSVERQNAIIRQQCRDEWSTLQRYTRSEARVQTLKECIIQSVSQLNELPKYVYRNGQRSASKSTEAILLLGDVHVGAKCDNSKNTYNTEIARQRLQELVSDTEKYCKLHNVTTLNVLNLGDLIQGIIHTNARIDQEVDVARQVMIAGEYIAETLNALTSFCPNVTYRSVIDNHSRLSPNKEESIENENMSLIIDWFLQERLKHTKIVFKNDNKDLSLGAFRLKNNKIVAFAHGHLESKTDVVQKITGALGGISPNYICLGHFHSPSVRSFQDVIVFINGSLMGTDSYAYSKRLFSAPTQKLIIFDDSNTVVDIDIGVSAGVKNNPPEII